MEVINLNEYPPNPKLLIVGGEDYEVIKQIFYHVGYNQPLANQEVNTQVARLFYNIMGKKTNP